MKGHDRLVRRHEWNLQEKRRKVLELERLARRLHAQLAALEREVRDERPSPASGPDGTLTDGGPAEARNARRARLRQSVRDVELEMGRALDEVAAASREFEKLDFIRARRRGNAGGLENQPDDGAPNDSTASPAGAAKSFGETPG